MKLQALALSFVLGATALSGCGDDKKDSTKNPGGGTPTTAATALKNALCEKQESCAATHGRMFADVASCKTYMFGEGCGVEVGFGNTDSELQACVTAMAAMDCDVLYGNLPAGNACASLEFEYSDYPMAGIGESCYDKDCVASAVCVESSEQGVCDVCVTTPGLNGDCSVSDYECQEGYYCAETGGTCQALLALGATCEYDGQCLSNWCDEATLKCTTALTLGAACTSTDKCAGEMGCVGNTCKSMVGTGASCASLPCATGAVCVSGTCQATAVCGNTIAVGSPCVSSAGCVTSAYCDYDTERCTTRKAAGAECSESDECQSGMECVYDGTGYVCMAPLQLGDACGAGNGFCDENLRCNTDLSEPVCAPLIALGAECTYSWDCETGYCDTAVEPFVCAEVAACMMP